MSKSQEPLHDHHPSSKNLRRLPRYRRDQGSLAGSHHSTRFRRYLETIFATRCTMQIRRTDGCNHVQSQVQRRVARYYRSNEQAKFAKVENVKVSRTTPRSSSVVEESPQASKRSSDIARWIASFHAVSPVSQHNLRNSMHDADSTDGWLQPCTITSSEAFREVLSLK